MTPPRSGFHQPKTRTRGRSTEAQRKRKRSLHPMPKAANEPGLPQLMNVSDDARLMRRLPRVAGLLNDDQRSRHLVNNQPPAAFEKLWRGLALVGSDPHRRDVINIIFQMMGNNSLDSIRPNSSALIIKARPRALSSAPVNGRFLCPGQPHRAQASNQAETQRSAAEHECLLLRDIEQH